MTRAFVYLRVSGKGQVEGDGFDRQFLACQAYAAEHSLEIVEVFREEGVSGANELADRPALSLLLAALEANGVKTILIEKLDRLARDLMVSETIIADLRKSGCTLLSTMEPDLCSEDPSRKLVRQIFGAIAEYEKKMIVLKLRGARQRQKARNGKCEGRHAFGKKPGEAAILARMLELRRQPITCAKIADLLNTEDVPTRGGRLWHPGTVAKILARKSLDTKVARRLRQSCVFDAEFAIQLGLDVRGKGGIN
ncbi:MAG: recombinase family protein [Terracidiphilus sp.]